MMMTRRDWWIGVAVVVLAILYHTLLPRYEWHPLGSTNHMIRVDRWRGTTSLIGPTLDKP